MLTVLKRRSSAASCDTGAAGAAATTFCFLDATGALALPGGACGRQRESRQQDGQSDFGFDHGVVPCKYGACTAGGRQISINRAA
jgi:hypothetical protein